MTETQQIMTEFTYLLISVFPYSGIAYLSTFFW